MRILVIEDSEILRESLVQGLEEAGYAVDCAGDGALGLSLAHQRPYDILVLDLMLPEIDGLSLLRQLRQAGHGAHVLILTARDGVEDRALGLDCGADDYMVKPFAFAELLARLRAIFRRRQEPADPCLRVSDLEINTLARTVRRGSRLVDVSAREYALLEFMAQRANRVVTRTEIWQHIYEFRGGADSNVVDVFIGLLRKKLERDNQPRLLHTHRGQGYRLGEGAE